MKALQPAIEETFVHPPLELVTKCRRKMSHPQRGTRPCGHTEPRGREEASLYEKFEGGVLPTFYEERDRFLEMMRHCIALNGSFFNTHRIIQQYV